MTNYETYVQRQPSMVLQLRKRCYNNFPSTQEKKKEDRIWCQRSISLVYYPFPIFGLRDFLTKSIAISLETSKDMTSTTTSN